MLLRDIIEICSPLHISNANMDADITSFVIDSREVKEGSCFIAIRGTQVDGHMFLDDAVARGAAVIITEDSFYTEREDICVLEVENTRSLAGPLAQAFEGNPGHSLKIVGITGTNGKTTTATLVYQMLMNCGKKASLLGTVSKRILDDEFDSHLTTSDPVELAADMKQMVDAGSEYLVMEVSSHALDQKRVKGFDFDVAAFTNLSHDHLDYHESLEEYAKAKKLLFDDLPASSVAVINGDDSKGSYMASECGANVVFLRFGENGHIIENAPEGLSLAIEGENIQSSLVGTFNAYNIGIAFLIGKALKLSPDEAADALKNAPGAPGRMETVKSDSETGPLVIVDYAHTPDALSNVCATLVDIKDTKQPLTVVFGAGGDRDTAKRPEMAQIAEKYADKIIVTSDNPRSENPDLIIADILDGFTSLDKVESVTERREAIERAIMEAASNEIVLIAGKGHETYQEIKGKRHPFDDREIAKEYLKKRAGGGTHAA